jgi:DNA-binding NarL/FixJ family response regulator
MTDEAHVLSRLIGDIYDAALDPGRWPNVLREACGFAGGSAAALYSKNAASKTGNERYRWNMDPAFDYFSTQVRFDPVTVTQFAFDVGDIYSIADLIPYHQFLETRVYKEWAKPQGWVDHLAATLEKSTTSFALFGIFRNEREGLADDEMRRRMRLIVPHVRRATLIGNILDLHESRGAMLADSFDTLPIGVFLVDARGGIVFANMAGESLLAEGDILHGPQRTLTLIDAQASRAFRDAIQAAAGGDAALGVRGIALPLSSQPNQRWVAHILPLTSGARRNAAIACAAAAAVFVRKTQIDTPSSMESIARLYRLTPGELRVFAAVVHVGGVSAVAEALGISEATVKTHLQHLFEKTGLRRQADLVKLIAGHADPLRG